MDEDDGDLQLKSIFQPVLTKVKDNLLKATVIFLPQCEIAILQVFSAEPLLAKVSF